jgi:hypothetical protein
MNSCCICWFFTHILMKCTVQGNKIPSRKSRQTALGFNFGVKGVMLSSVAAATASRLFGVHSNEGQSEV